MDSNKIQRDYLRFGYKSKLAVISNNDNFIYEPERTLRFTTADSSQQYNAGL